MSKVRLILNSDSIYTELIDKTLVLDPWVRITRNHTANLKKLNRIYIQPDKSNPKNTVKENIKLSEKELNFINNSLLKKSCSSESFMKWWRRLLKSTSIEPPKIDFEIIDPSQIKQCKLKHLKVDISDLRYLDKLQFESLSDLKIIYGQDYVYYGQTICTDFELKPLKK